MAQRPQVNDEWVYQEYSYAGMCFEEFTRSQIFLRARASQVKCFLEKDDIMAPSEDRVYYALQRWYQKNKIERLRDFFDVLQVVRLPLVPHNKFDIVEDDILSVSQNFTRHLLREANYYRWAFARERAAMRCPRTIRRILPATRKCMYVLGAPNAQQQSLQRYAFGSGAWTVIEQRIPVARKEPAVAAFKGCVWVAGGLMAGNKPLESVCAYDPIAQTWSERPFMKERRYGFGLIALNGNLYAIGGRNEYPDPGSLDTVEFYDGLSWTSGVSMNEARYALEVGVAGGLIFAAGGWDESQYTALTSVEHYDPFTSSWCAITPMMYKRRSFRLVTDDNIVYLVGGDRGHTVEEYNSLAHRWNGAASYTLTPGRSEFAATSLDGVIYLLGGLHGSLETKSFQSLSPSCGEMSDLQESPVAPGICPRAVVIEHPGNV